MNCKIKENFDGTYSINNISWDELSHLQFSLTMNALRIQRRKEIEGKLDAYSEANLKFNNELVDELTKTISME